MPEKEGLRERAANKLIEVLIAALVKAEHIQARMKTTLKQLSRGEIDGLLIQMSGFQVRSHLRVETFRFEIGPAAVSIPAVMRRRIELVHPSTGTLEVAIDESSLADFFQAEFTNLSDSELSLRLESVECTFQTGAITLTCHWTEAGESRSGSYRVVPQILPGQPDLELVVDPISPSLPAELVTIFTHQLNSLLSLSDLANQGTTFQIQHIQVEDRFIRIQADADIDQFPGSAASAPKVSQ